MDAGFFFFFFFSIFCDVATIGDHLQEELAKFGNFRTKNSSKSGNFGAIFAMQKSFV
jgi:hypothetical protein